MRQCFIFIAILAYSFLTVAVGSAQETSEYVNKAWAENGKRNFEAVYTITSECIDKFSQEADGLAQTLYDFPAQEKVSKYQVMNDVATCYFIQAEALIEEGKMDQAEAVLQKVIEKYPYAQAWDPRGWFWSIREKSEITLRKITQGVVVEEDDVDLEDVVITKITLYDQGKEFPVNYEKYGRFINVGKKGYKYEIIDPIGLSKAVGEGITPNTSSLKFDPNFVKVKKELGKVDHWKILNSRDLNLAFYKWNMAPEPRGVRQFYIADILERSGHLKHAIKAYYSVVVHYPESVGWTYWQTPWYIGKVALYRIKFILKEHPELCLELKDASIEVVNGQDNDIRNDEFIVNPGRFVKSSFITKLFQKRKKERNTLEITKTVGKGFSKLVQYKSGDWQLFVHGKPFIVRGITYDPTRVGESPDKGTLSNWTTQDVNGNGIVDSPFETWVDSNGNNVQDVNEPIVGDFQLMKEMGVNAIRKYHQPHPIEKGTLRKLYEDYGIYVMLGDFLGKYAIGSGATWEEGTDYDNVQQQQTMLESVKTMVTEFRDEPYIIMWLLGNENVYGLGCNADKKPQSFFKFANKAARLIKELDPLQRPVAIVSGDVLFLEVFAQECPDIDIFGTNAYRGKYGFLDLWDEVKRTSGKAAMITEYGCPSYAHGFSQEEAQAYQSLYHYNAWKDISGNAAGYGAGNSVGGIVFEWLDEWWKAYEPSYHDRKGLFAGPFLDGYMHEEWLGLCGQGNGEHSPFLRQLKQSYYTYQQLWTQ